MEHFLEGFVSHRKEDADKYIERRWWAGLTLGDILDKAADIYPNHEALVDASGRLTYSQVRDKANQLAVGMMRLGIEPQERVLLQLPNWNEFAYTFFALQKIGAITVPLIDRYRQYEINHLLKLTGATAWIVPERYRKLDYLPIIEDVLRKNPQVRHVILVRSEGRQKFLKLETLMGDADGSGDQLHDLSERRPNPMQVAHMGDPRVELRDCPRSCRARTTICCATSSTLRWPGNWGTTISVFWRVPLDMI